MIITTVLVEILDSFKSFLIIKGIYNETLVPIKLNSNPMLRSRVLGLVIFHSSYKLLIISSPFKLYIINIKFDYTRRKLQKCNFLNNV